jgi:hypothetical protein
MVVPSNLLEQVFWNCLNGALRMGYSASVHGGRKETIENLTTDERNSESVTGENSSNIGSQY